MVRFVVGVASLSAAISLSAPVYAQAQAQAPQKAIEVKQKKICRADPASTGSIMPKRICHTQDEWDSINQQSEQQAEQILQRQEQLTRDQTGNGR